MRGNADENIPWQEENSYLDDSKVDINDTHQAMSQKRFKSRY